MVHCDDMYYILGWIKYSSVVQYWLWWYRHMFVFLTVLWYELVPFSIWLNSHTWTIGVIFLGQVMVVDKPLKGLKSVPSSPLQHKSTVNVSPCFFLGRGCSVPVLPLAVLCTPERGLRQSPLHLHPRGPTHNFCLTQLPLTLVPIVQFEPNMFQEGGCGSGGGGR